MGLKVVEGDIAIPSAARGAGTVTSAPIANAGAASVAVLLVHASASSGTPTLDASLEESADNSAWTAIPGSSITQLTAAGNRLAMALTTKNYVRVTSAVAGTTPNVTYAAVLMFI